jgi:uncharacterized protein (TIGR00251 family)
MNIAIKVKPNAKEEKIEKISESEYLLWVRSPAQEGKANQAAITLLSDFLDIPKTRITIVRGHKSRNKIVSIV